MQYTRLVLAGVLVFAFAGVAHANSLTDPGAIIKGGHGSFVIHGLSFSLHSSTGTGTFVFDNGNNFALKSLTLSFTPGGPTGMATFTCGIQPGNSGVNAFTTCMYTHLGGPSSPTTLVFSGGPGIGAHSEFAIELFGWPSNLMVQGQATVPEPATISLVLLGAGAGLLRRRRKTA